MSIDSGKSENGLTPSSNSLIFVPSSNMVAEERLDHDDEPAQPEPAQQEAAAE